MKLTVAEAQNLLRTLALDDTIDVSIGARMNAITMFDKFQHYTTKDAILDGEYSPLRCQEITLSEAAAKYNIPRPTIESWYYRSQYLKQLNPGIYPATFDESEVAYLADIYKERLPIGSRAPLLNNAGLPYQLKNPDMALHRRKKKTGPLAE